MSSIYSVLFYLITLEGRRGTTDKFATIPFHLVLFSAALVELEKSISVHSLILSLLTSSSVCLFFLFPFTVSCRIDTWRYVVIFPNEPGRAAQSVGHLTRKSGILGSIPGLATYFRFSFRFFKKGSCQLLAKVCARSTA